MMNIRIVLFLFIIIFCLFCKREDKEAADINYRIYLDNQYQILKIDDGRNTTSFQYTDSKIIETSSFGRTTFFINDHGLADSSYYETLDLGKFLFTGVKYYRYNKDGYLEYDGSFWCTYNEGNRIDRIQDSTITESERYNFHYEYTSLPNIIDVDEFRGQFLGKLNRNLISRSITTHAGFNHNVEFSYILDNRNFVIRSVITTSIPTSITVINYKYIFPKE